jgi:lipopolysaccharide/colanic/teichoic acid biosynthesis glycosyltransferase
MKLNRIRQTFQFDSNIPNDYTERGAEKGAKFSDGGVENPDVVKILESTKQMSFDETLTWIGEHHWELHDSTVIIDSDDGSEIKKTYGAAKPKMIVQKRALNKIRHLNTLLNKSNETLDNNGYIWCHCRTAVLKRRLMMERYPWGVNYLIFFFHFLWHRVIPKMSWTKWFYFWLTKGKNRTYNRVEVLGRMYRAGFEVVDEEFRQGEFFVLARKINVPLWDDVPSGSPIIKLQRVGKNGKMIGVYKFRTMYSYSEYLQPYIYEHNHLQQGGKFADDYRVTPWGRWMRKLWIDELPMVFNLLKGELKLVGVRPLSLHYYSLYTPEMQELRTKVKPGLLPPFYYEKQPPKTIEEVQMSERRYIEAYMRHPVSTDIRYFFGTIGNILFHGATSN